MLGNVNRNGCRPAVGLISFTLGMCMETFWIRNLYRVLLGIQLLTAPIASVAMGAPVEPIRLMWQVTPEVGKLSEICELKKYGINYVQSFGLLRQKPEYIEAYLNEAAGCGMRVMVFVGREFNENPDKRQALKNIVDTIKYYDANPAIYAWHAIDEPANDSLSVEETARYVAAVKAATKKKIFVSTNAINNAEVKNFLDAVPADLFDFHRYVNPFVGERQHRMVRSLLANARSKSNIIITCRAFNSPHKIQRLNIQPGVMRQELDLYLRSGFNNIGFYGWNLAPNEGIAKDPEIMNEFKSVADYLLSK